MTRVSGASAGAIAAVLLAGRANIDALIQHHKALGQSGDILKAFPDVSNPGLLEKLFNFGKVAGANQTLGDESAFARIVESSLKVAGITAKNMGELEIPCLINCTDIVEHRTLVAEDGQPIVQSIVDSAALPFLFRNGGQKIDGGILNNLPVELLAPEDAIMSEYGRIVGVSFQPEKYSAQTTNATQLAKRLLETVINDRVKRSKEILGKNRFLEIETQYDGVEFSTFSVDAYVKAVSSDTVLKLVEEQTRRWFEDFAAAMTEEDTPVDTSASSIDHAAGVVEELSRFADALHQKNRCDLVSTVFEVTARSMSKSGTDLDEVVFVDEFRVVDDPVYSVVARISLNEGSAPDNYKVSVFDAHGVEIPASKFLIPDEAHVHYWVLILLENPIIPDASGAVFTLRSQQTGKRLMGPLLDSGADYLSLGVNKSSSAEAAEIRLFVPDDSSVSVTNGTSELLSSLGVHCSDAEDMKLVPGYLEPQNARNSDRCPTGYKALVWKSENLAKGQLIRALYHTKRHTLE